MQIGGHGSHVRDVQCSVGSTANEVAKTMHRVTRERDSAGVASEVTYTPDRCAVPLKLLQSHPECQPRGAECSRGNTVNGTVIATCGARWVTDLLG